MTKTLALHSKDVPVGIYFIVELGMVMTVPLTHVHKQPI